MRFPSPSFRLSPPLPTSPLRSQRLHEQQGSSVRTTSSSVGLECAFLITLISLTHDVQGLSSEGSCLHSAWLDFQCSTSTDSIKATVASANTTFSQRVSTKVRNSTSFCLYSVSNILRNSRTHSALDRHTVYAQSPFVMPKPWLIFDSL